jgi:membrane associated rhomboid family serine protease
MSPWVRRLIIANTVVFLLQVARPVVTNLFAFVPALFFSRPWTLVTYMFLHGGFSHILFNMLGLYFFGPRLEAELGGRRFIGLYFFSGVMGGLFSFLTPFAAIIGASGAVYGVMLGFAHYWPREPIYVWGIFAVEARWFVVIMTALSLFGGFGAGGEGIAHFAHLGGFAGGYLYLKVIDRSSGRLDLRQWPLVSAPGAADLERWMKIRRDTLHEVNRLELDRIMAKIKSSGAAELTSDERAFLDRFSA